MIEYTRPPTGKASTMALVYGKVVGKLITVRGDGVDGDRLPDSVGATAITPTFKPHVSTFVESDIKALVAAEAVRGKVATDGTLQDERGGDGVWLLVGTYTVVLGGHHPEFPIVVTAAHTDAAPLDLATATPYVPPTGSTVQVVSVPAGAADGQVLGWDGGLTWLSGAAGAPGADGADGASAYEVAVAGGFVGTEAAWLASLVGPAGADGAPGAPGADGADGATGATGPAGTTTWAGITDKPTLPVFQYASTSTPARPATSVVPAGRWYLIITNPALADPTGLLEGDIVVRPAS